MNEDKFIAFAYDAARDKMMTPKRLEYARDRERQLYDGLMRLTSMKQAELCVLIARVIQASRPQILDEARRHSFVDVDAHDNDNGNGNGNDNDNDDKSSNSSRSYKKCVRQVEELVLTRVNETIGEMVVKSVLVLKDNYLGTLRRCLKSLEDDSTTTTTTTTTSTTTQHHYQQTTVTNNNKANASTQSSSVSHALQQILNTAYKLDIDMSANSSLIASIIQRIKQV